jgi:hypothetical protein
LGSSPPTVFRGWRRKYKAASRKIKEGLAEKRYKEAAEVATRMAFAITPPKYSFNAILAGVQAYQIGKEQDWRPSPEELAERGIRKAEEVTHYRLSPKQVKTVKRLIKTSLDKLKKEMEGPS